jgi:hypothetical protein
MVTRTIDRLVVGLAFLAVVGALVVAVAYDAPLTWDGAYYLFKTLDLQTPFVPNNRLINIALQQPLLVASQFTSDLGVLRHAFDAGYVLIPLITLTCAWWFCRARPGMFKWPALGICVASLPGRMFFVGESTMVTDLFWPLVLGLLLAEGRPAELLVLALLGAGVWAAHPTAVVLFGLAALAAASRAWAAHPRGRRWWAVCAVCLVLAGNRALLPLSGYELESASAQRLGEAFDNSIAGKPLLALVLTAGVACLWLLRPLLIRTVDTRIGVAVDVVAAGLILLAGGVLAVWASRPDQWASALDFRSWQVFVSLGLVLLAVADKLWHASASERWTPVVLACALSFCLVVSVQVRSWARLTRDFETWLAAQDSACTTLTTLSETRGGSPLNHWATAVYAIVLQSRTPTRFILDSQASCAELLATGSLAIAAWDVRPPNGGWFYLNP